MCDPPSGRRRMGACETTPTTTRDRGNQPSGPSRTQPAERLFLASDRRPPLAGIKLVRPRPRLPGAALRALQLDPGLARRHKPAATRKATIKVHPSPGGREQVTGSTQHGLLTAGAPMGASMPAVMAAGLAGSRLVTIRILDLLCGRAAGWLAAWA